jgi:hypothetical protein
MSSTFDESLATEPEKQFLRLIADKFSTGERNEPILDDEMRAAMNMGSKERYYALLNRMADFGFIRDRTSGRGGDGFRAMPKVVDAARRLEAFEQARRHPNLVEQYRAFASSHPVWSRLIIWAPVAYFGLSFVNELLAIVDRILK